MLRTKTNENRVQCTTAARQAATEIFGSDLNFGFTVNYLDKLEGLN